MAGPQTCQRTMKWILASIFLTSAVGALPEGVSLAIGAAFAGSACGEAGSSDGFQGPSRLLRQANRHRNREEWKGKVACMSGKKFRKRFKVSRQRFASLVSLIANNVEPSDIGKYMAQVSSRSHISAEVCLAVTLRWLAGSHFGDLEDLYGVEENYVYKCIWKTMQALDNKLKLYDFDPFNIEQCKLLAQKMYIRSKRTIAGCIGALDGMCVRIWKPRQVDVDNPLHFLNRKGFFSLNLQAIANADRAFLWFSLETAGGTHDSLAFRVSELSQKLEKDGLPKSPDGNMKFWIAGDDAYACSEYLISPYSKASCKGCPERDNFNFYQSRCRINIECAFGILVERFGVLRRPMRCRLDKVVLVVSVCMKLHNICIEDAMSRVSPDTRDIQATDLMRPINQDKVAYVPWDIKKRQATTLRTAICEDLQRAGYVRPVREGPKRRRTN